MSDALTERGRALEDMFFAARDQERVAALRARAELEGAAASLSQQTLVEDEAVLHRVVGLGVTVETLAAFSVVPLLYVAWGDRVLDLDIILWSGGVWRSVDLKIPHPAFAQRRFVLDPACTIAPDWRDPLSGLTLAQAQARLTRPRPLPR